MNYAVKVLGEPVSQVERRTPIDPNRAIYLHDLAVYRIDWRQYVQIDGMSVTGRTWPSAFVALIPFPLGSIHHIARDQLNAATTVSIGRNKVRLSSGYSKNSAHFR